MELFNSTINNYDQIEDNKYTNEEDLTWLQTQVVFNFLVYNLLHLLSCHLKLHVGVIVSSFQNFDFILLLSNVTFCPKLSETKM